MRAIFATLYTLLCTLSLLGMAAHAQEPARNPGQAPAPPPQTEQPAATLQNTISDGPEVPEPEALYRSLWLEAGLGYRPSSDGLLIHPRVGLRGIQPLTDTVALYAAVAYDGAITVDIGGWYSFLSGTDDVFGFRSYAGTGLSYVAGSFGIALNAALSYELSTQTSLVVVYTYRALVFSEFSGLSEFPQAFDLSLGVAFTLP